MRRSAPLATAAVLTLVTGLACFGGSDGDPEMEAEISELHGTALVADEVPLLAPIAMSESGRPEVDLGNGVQVFQVSPVGTDRRALQAAVVFDRAMVPLTGLSDMNAAVPLSCSPEAGLSGRWAGTSTAVISPAEGAFALATEFTCSVPAGTAAIDGVALEKPLSWSFETARPTVSHASPYRGASRWDPERPLELNFDQPVTLDSVRTHTKVTRSGNPVPSTIEVNPDAENGFLVTAKLAKDTEYVLVVEEGVLAQAGPLPMSERFDTNFRTYPPLTAEVRRPEGQVEPRTSMALDFTTPVSRDEVAAHLSVSPEPPGWEPPTGEWTSSSYWYYPSWQPRTDYTVTLAAGMKDEYGQALEEALVFSFSTGDYNPHLNVPEGLRLVGANNPAELPMQHLNAQGLSARMTSVDPSQIDPYDWRGTAARAIAAAGGEGIASGDTPNEIARADVSFDRLLTGGKGWIVTDVTAANLRTYKGELRHHQALLVVTDLAGTLKLSPGAADVWVTSLETGQPVADAQVELLQGDRVRATVTTDGDGSASFQDGPDKTWREWGDSNSRFWARITKGDDVSLVTQSMNDGIGPWAFGIYADFEPRGFDVAAHGFADRGVYRPGDPVHARATFRKQTADGLETPTAKVTWRLDDPEGTTHAEGEGVLDDRGGINVQTTVPEDGMLGGWDLVVEGEGEGWERRVYISIPAHAYREPAFRVSVSAASDGVAGDPIEATAQARYLFGAPLPRAKVTWNTWTEPTRFDPEGWDGWSFGPPPRGWWEEDDGEGLHTASREEGEVLDGKATFTETVETLETPVRLFLEASVEDMDRQLIASSATTFMHPASVYGGVRAGERMPVAGESTWVEVAAVDTKGKAASGMSLEVEVVRTKWDSVREKGMDGRWTWVTTKTETDVHGEAVTSAGAGQRVTFIPTEPGRHTVRVTATDSSGRSTTASETLWVVGSGYAPWARRDDGLLALVPDKEVYAPGDTANILVQAPVPGLSAMVTVEREGVLHSQVVKLEGTAETVEIPITAAYRPNVFVSVVAVTGAGPQDAPDKGRPEVFVGMKQLSVETETEHLSVDVTPKAELYRPRDTVEVTVAVERAGERVAGAGVTLFAVDEAVLSLTNYQTPDAHGAMYAERGLSTLTADARTGVLDRSSYLTKGANRGGGGGFGDGPQLRTDFVTTVTWQPDLKTGPDGTVTASFKLKDNLTTFRVMAVVDDEATGFGSGDHEITVTRPIVARPALPRVLRPGDTAFAGVVVHNNSDEVREILVEGSVTGPVTLEGSPTTIFLAPGNAREVPFKLEATAQGTATFDFLVSSDVEKDGVRHEVEVVKDLVREVVASSGSTESSLTEAIAKPDGVVPGEGGLQVDLATTALVGAGAGLDYLVEYPHGCVEQRTSRALGSLMALRVRESAGVEVPEATLRANVEGVLAELKGFEHPTGGLSYWRGSSAVSIMGTAYAVDFMGRAKEAGFEVDEDLLDNNARFLREAARGKHVPSWWNPLASRSVRASVALSLARIDRADTGLHNELYNARRSLSTVSVAQLTEAIARSTGADSRTSALIGELESRMVIEASAATVREEEGGKFRVLWGSDDLASAATLEALLAVEDKPALGPKLALGLAQSRKRAYWANTRGTAGVLAALAGYADRFESGGGEVTATVALAGKELYGEALKLPASDSATVSLADLTDGKLTIEADGGRLYYQSRLSYVLENAPPTDQGFTMVRKLELIEGGTPEGRVSAGAALRVTLQVITPVTRYDVAVIDRIPAGLEPVNGSFATTSRAPEQPPELGVGTAEVPDWGGDWVFDHHEIDDDQVRLYADWMPPGIHTFRYQVRATSPGDYAHPPATVEEMYEPENFGRTGGGRLTVGRSAEVAAQ